MPSNRAAWLMEDKGHPFQVKEAPYPECMPGTVIIKSVAIAVNPVDHSIQDGLAKLKTYPAIIGVDVAGEVVEFGEGVTHLQKGQRVFAQAGPRGGTLPTGVYQTYVRAPGSTTLPIPPSLSFVSACCLPLSVSTAAASLYEKDKLALPYPSLNPTPTNTVILVWGGSSSVGSSAIQLARASGVEVFSTASPHNFDYVKALGASQVFDHTKPDVAQQIIAALKDKKFVGISDSVSKPESTKAVVTIAKATGLSLFTGVRPGDEDTEGVTKKTVFAITVQQNEVGPAVWSNYLYDALVKGAFVPKPEPEVVGKGLEDIQKAVDLLKAGVSAKKLVVLM